MPESDLDVVPVAQSLKEKGEIIPHLSKKRKKVAVKEEEFEEALTSIIRRDFFPDLTRLEANIKTNDDTSILSSEGCTSGSEVQGTQPETKEQKSQDDVNKLKLDQFLSKYESEDDASFTDMLDKYHEANRQKHAWLHEKEQEYSRLTTGDKFALRDSSESNRRAGLDSWTYTAKNSLMYIPDGVEQSAVEAVREATKTREIVHSNTRLPSNFVHKYQQSIDCPKKPAQNKVGIDGKVLAVDQSPKVNGYGFMATPKIQPGVDASPLMTWGSIEGTPLRLDSDPVPPSTSFKMPKIPAREKVALKLADQVAKANREKKRNAAIVASPLLRERLGTTPSKSDRLRLLSPAARKLICQKTKYSDKALDASYSPQITFGGRTPNYVSKSTLAQNTPATSLTDDLLNI